jgi:hypothetical protein
MTQLANNFEIVRFDNVENYTQLPADIAQGIGRAVNSAFGGTVTEEDAREHMAGDQVLVAIDAGAGVVAGFTSTTITSPRERFGEPILTDHVGTYFAGAAIAKPYQGRGLYHKLNTQRLDYALTNNGECIFTQTQNPRVVEGLTDDLNRLVSTQRIGGFSVSKVIRQGAYGQMLTAEKPVARHLELDLDYERGDAAVVTWHLEK